MPTTKFTSEIISAAIEGYETQKRRIDAQIAELRGRLSGDAAGSTAAPKPAQKRRISAAARHRMAVAQRARWAKIKAGSAPAAASQSAAKKKARISAAGLRRIIAANKKRWALKRAEAAKAEAAKKAAKQS
jgi:hypothetical protein